MSEIKQHITYWLEVRDLIKVFSKNNTLERYLFNQADFEELVNVIFDDLDVQRHIDSLPHQFDDFRLAATKYFETLGYLVGDGPLISRQAPIYNAHNRAGLFSATERFLVMFDQFET